MAIYHIHTSMNLRYFRSHRCSRYSHGRSSTVDEAVGFSFVVLFNVGTGFSGVAVVVDNETAFGAVVDVVFSVVGVMLVTVVMRGLVETVGENGVCDDAYYEHGGYKRWRGTTVV